MATLESQVHAAKAFLLKTSPDSKNNLYVASLPSHTPWLDVYRYRILCFLIGMTISASAYRGCLVKDPPMLLVRSSKINIITYQINIQLFPIC